MKSLSRRSGTLTLAWLGHSAFKLDSSSGKVILIDPWLVLLPIGGFYAMGPREAALACTLLKPEYLIGMHYGTFPVLTGTPAQLRTHLPAQLKKCVIELGNAVTF